MAEDRSTTKLASEQAAERETAVKHNLEDLRGRLTIRLAILALAGAQLSIIGYESPNRFPFEVMAYWFTLTVVAIGTLWLSGRNPVVARHVLVWGLTAVLVESMALFPVAWVPFLGLLLIICAALLIQGSEFVSGIVVTGTAVYLHTQGIRDYQLTGLITLNFLALIIAFLAIRTLYTALDWLWRTHQKAERLLETTRAQQGELKSTVKSLQITNELRIQAERELMIAHKQAREAQQMKEQFAANISHELRTPLSIILGFSEVMYLSPEVYGDMAWSSKLYRDINQIYRNSRHLLVIDPDPGVASLAQRHVVDCEVVPVADETELIEQVSTYHPAGIVWNLPPGEKLPQSLLQDVPVPVIGCSLPSAAATSPSTAPTSCALLKCCAASPRFCRRCRQDEENYEKIIDRNSCCFCRDLNWWKNLHRYDCS